MTTSSGTQSGWAQTQLTDIAEVNPRLPNEPADSTPVSFVPMRAVSEITGEIDVTEERPYGEVKKGYTRFLEGDVLFAKITPCMENGKVAIARGLRNGVGAGSTEFHVVRPLLAEFSRGYLFHYFVQERFRHETQRYMTGTAGQLRVPKKYLEDVEIPVAPIPEQRQIVEKIEELFTQLDAGVAALEQAKAWLRRYRQAVLKAAVEGELTREWREAHQGELEPASVLLERILEERWVKWEAEQLEKMRARGKEPKSDRWKQKYREPWKPDTDGLPQLPIGWTWTSFEEVAEATPHALKAGPFGSSLKKEYYVPKGYKIYGQEQVIRGDPFYGDYYIDDERYRKLKACAVKPGDVLISLVGTIGRVLILPEGIEPGIINPRLVKLSLDKSLVKGKYVKTYLESSSVRHYFSLSSHGGTMDILNLTILKALPIALPPLREQQVIVDEVERCISIADELDRVVEHSLKRADRLRQSILKKAFEGKLVLQDPSDEPASMLLERIQAEKARREAERKTKKRSRKKKQPQQLELLKMGKA